MVQFPNGPEAVYAVIRGGDIYSHTNEVQDKEVHAKKQDRENKNKTHASQPDVEKEERNMQDTENKKKTFTTDDFNRTSKLIEEITENIDDTDYTDDTDDTDETIY